MRVSSWSQQLTDAFQQLSYYFPDKTMWQSFVCAMTAAVTLHALDPFRTGKLVLYQVVYTTGWHGFEMVPFAILGVFGVSAFQPSMQTQLTSHIGPLWWSFHHCKYESCRVEEIRFLVTGTHYSSCSCCTSHCSNQLSEPLYASPVIRIGLLALC